VRKKNLIFYLWAIIVGAPHDTHRRQHETEHRISVDKNTSPEIILIDYCYSIETEQISQIGSLCMWKDDR